MKKWILLSLLGLIVGCTWDSMELEQPDCVEDFTYEEGINDIITVSCATPGCHVSGVQDVPGIFSTHEQLITFLENGSFENQVRTEDMPPQGSPPLSDVEKDNLLCWIEQGFPKN